MLASQIFTPPLFLKYFVYQSLHLHFSSFWVNISLHGKIQNPPSGRKVNTGGEEERGVNSVNNGHVGQQLIGHTIYQNPSNIFVKG